MFRHSSSAEHPILDFTHGFDQGDKLLLVGGEVIEKLITFLIHIRVGSVLIKSKFTCFYHK